MGHEGAGVVLEVGDSDARIGIEGIEEDPDGHWIPAADVQWARKRGPDGRLGPRAQVAGDLLVGEAREKRTLLAATFAAAAAPFASARHEDDC